MSIVEAVARAHGLRSKWSHARYLGRNRQPLAPESSKLARDLECELEQAINDIGAAADRALEQARQDAQDARMEAMDKTEAREQALLSELEAMRRERGY